MYVTSDGNIMGSVVKSLLSQSECITVQPAANETIPQTSDCCAHFLLGCLFCEVTSMCSALGAWLACGGGVSECCCEAICCCCQGERSGGVACSEEACLALRDCCSSAACMDVCLECCSLCFPT